MYYPEKFFNVDVLIEVFRAYSWPATYTVQESKLNGAIIKFPKCDIVISEGFEGSISAYFPNYETGRSDHQASLTIFDAIEILKPIRELEIGFIEPISLVKNLDVEPSVQKVKQGLNNICILLQTYLLPCITGDFSWVEEYNKKYDLT